MKEEPPGKPDYALRTLHPCIATNDKRQKFVGTSHRDNTLEIPERQGNTLRPEHHQETINLQTEIRNTKMETLDSASPQQIDKVCIQRSETSNPDPFQIPEACGRTLPSVQTWEQVHELSRGKQTATLTRPPPDASTCQVFLSQRLRPGRQFILPAPPLLPIARCPQNPKAKGEVQLSPGNKSLLLSPPHLPAVACKPQVHTQPLKV